MIDYFINNATNQLPENHTTLALLHSDAIGYHKTLPAYQPTPLTALPALAKKCSVANIYIKDDSYRFGLSAFKGLGASYAIHKLVVQNPEIKTFCTATDGNHGRAVAWAAGIANARAIVFVPRDTAKSRIKAIENEGGKVIEVDGNYDEACAFAETKSKEEGWTLVQDTAWENYEAIPAQIMAGYLTQFQEMENSVHGLPGAGIDYVFLQAGVGSWAAAAIWYYINRYGNNRPKLIIVEPDEADGILASFKAGKRVMPTGSFKTMMAGLNCGIPSLSAWDIIKCGADAAMKISDDYAARAMNALYYPIDGDTRVIAGESGAGGLAGFIALMAPGRFNELRTALGINAASNILCYNTEGATDLENFNKIIGRNN
jgi:diaminopropionate ammonia-lyase